MKKVIVTIGVFIFAFALYAKDPLKAGMKIEKEKTEKAVKCKSIKADSDTTKPIPEGFRKKEGKSAQTKSVIKQASAATSLKAEESSPQK